MFVVGGAGSSFGIGPGSTFNLYLQFGLHTAPDISSYCATGICSVSEPTYMSNGYTSAFASTAPAEPATALPHGGSFSSLDAPAIVGLSTAKVAKAE